MRHVHLMLLAAVLISHGLGTSHDAVAGTLFNVNFNQMSVGSPPTFGQPVIEPSAAWVASPTTCLVQQQFGDLLDKPLVFFDPTATAAAKVQFELSEPMTLGRIGIFWRCAAGQIARGGEMTLYGASGIVLWMRYDQSGQIYVHHGNGSGSETSSLVGTYAIDHANQFHLDVDMTAHRFSLSIDGVAVLSDRALLNPGAPLALVVFGSETSEPDAPRPSNSYGLDDVVIETNPASTVPVADMRVANLHQNLPNPFNPRTTIEYNTAEAGSMRLSVFDMAGRLVRTLVDESMPQGSHEAVWDGRDASGREVGSGSYLARLEFGGNVETMRMGLIR